MDVKTRKTKAFRYFCMGLSSSEIGKLLDVSPRTVQTYIHKGRWKDKRNVSKLKQAAYDMYDGGMKYKEVAEALGVSKSSVYNYIREVREQREELAAKYPHSGLFAPSTGE